MEIDFPPPLVKDNRVWTTGGYQDHGPLDGPKVNIAPNMGGTITDLNSQLDSTLYTVQWDNGQKSKHYFRGLFCIGRFASLSDFESAINITGPVELTLGPQGGFRSAKLALEYDGESLIIELDKYYRKLWIDTLEPLAKNHGTAIETIILPSKK